MKKHFENDKPSSNAKQTTHAEVKEFKKNSKAKKACVELEILTAFVGVSFKKGDYFLPWEIRSYDENKIRKNLVGSKHREEVLKFQQINLSRIFPKGTRFDSSNYDPIYAWAHGA